MDQLHRANLSELSAKWRDQSWAFAEEEECGGEEEGEVQPWPEWGDESSEGVCEDMVVGRGSGEEVLPVEGVGVEEELRCQGGEAGDDEHVGGGEEGDCGSEPSLPWLAHWRGGREECPCGGGGEEVSGADAAAAVPAVEGGVEGEAEEEPSCGQEGERAVFAAAFPKCASTWNGEDAKRCAPE